MRQGDSYVAETCLKFCQLEMSHYFQALVIVAAALSVGSDADHPAHGQPPQEEPPATSFCDLGHYSEPVHIQCPNKLPANGVKAGEKGVFAANCDVKLNSKGERLRYRAAETLSSCNTQNLLLFTSEYFEQFGFNGTYLSQGQKDTNDVLKNTVATLVPLESYENELKDFLE